MRNRYYLIFVYIMFLTILGCGDESYNNVDSQPENDTTSKNRVIHVPGDTATIQAGINKANLFDTVLVADGTYRGEGNRDLDFNGKKIILKSESGPEATIIDCDGNSDSEHRGFYFTEQENDSAIVDGFTVTEGYIGNGGAVYCQSSSPTFRNCVFAWNEGNTSGGAIWCKSSQIRFINCTIAKNSSNTGSALLVSSGATPYFENCIIAFNGADTAVYIRSSNLPEFHCCNIFGNNGGDWTGDIANQAGENGNLNVDPRFCNAVTGNFHIHENSPCAPENNSCQVLIGAMSHICPN